MPHPRIAIPTRAPATAAVDDVILPFQVEAFFNVASERETKFKQPREVILENRVLPVEEIENGHKDTKADRAKYGDETAVYRWPVTLSANRNIATPVSIEYSFNKQIIDVETFSITAVRLSEKETRENPLVSVASGEKWTVST